MVNIDNAKCSVPGCKNTASVEVILYDVYRDVNPPIVFFEQDFTCPYLCKKHWVQNEKEAKEVVRQSGKAGITLEDIGNIELVPAQEVRRLRGAIHYPFSNKHRAQGFTIYRPLKEEIQELLNIRDENQTFERKASMLYDYKENRCNGTLKHVIARSVAGFMNKDGGTLLIGVHDDGTVLGLKKDYECLKKGPDEWQQVINQFLLQELGQELSAHFEVTIVQSEGKDLCVVKVKKSSTGVWVQNGSVLPVRVGNTTNSLKGQEAAEYLRNRSRVD